MKKIAIVLSLLLLSCISAKQELTSAWGKSKYTDTNGIVEIATGWGWAPLCTGSLISERAIITAAHCAEFPAEDLYIVYGCDNISNKTCTRVPVKKIITHPEWKKEFAFSDDIALMFVEKPIKNIGLAKFSDRTAYTEGLSVKAVGFGHRNGNSGILYAGRGRIARNYEKELVVFMPGKLDPNPGDSGGPAFILEDGQWKMIGILSRSQWGGVNKEALFEQSGYAIYSKPTAYLKWIYTTIYNECTHNSGC